MVARTLALLAPVVLPACVTQNVQFEPPPHYPPSVETPDSLGARHPLGNIIRLSELRAEADGGVADPSVELRVEVRDPNVDETLRWVVFLNFDPSSGALPMVPRAGSFPSEEGSIARRPPAISIPAALFRTRRCNRIELFVTGEDGFLDAPDQRLPVREGDLGTATWFVVDDMAGDVPLSECSPWI